ncbi:PduM family microcompartment protein [Limosilactobacillus reuteri]|jgi:microcompartment protein PduM|uniref:Propanediol utilization protein PduM n=1 Tax=Limosilactobacillus reuteri TaxID=1598 RepID=A0A0U5FCP2_LIMRT|nr:PduM family microcompartment protein [Limosilactobacillus reuteri]CUR39216.1 Propanediol utilization protein PduM [Limosilactobacillus reuteri subsp. porcinus]MCC4386820.1 PduM family microcompartment protein [Limosilactobacillus reuteri]MCC4392558.1 PduM family microcompartment protein [Limosilactobacillus reuteri]NMV55115.1 PduM family microcompartment protein [Limosilactobacillus reuteri]NMV57215.1 PduM family microcompartment protein [Limosilactobacillus reuteri]
MDNLVQQVMQRLEERKHTSVKVTFNHQVAPPSEQIFLRNGKVILKDVSIELITDLYSMEKTNTWVKWVLEGISYDVKFYFLINEQMVNFIPRMMILDWPILFVVNNESPMIASYNRVITRGEIAAKPDKSILVRYQKQRITDEAVDICNYKKIKIKIRTEENCIWRE